MGNFFFGQNVPPVIMFSKMELDQLWQASKKEDYEPTEKNYMSGSGIHQHSWTKILIQNH